LCCKVTSVMDSNTVWNTAMVEKGLFRSKDGSLERIIV
jgi:hypothetical protein